MGKNQLAKSNCLKTWRVLERKSLESTAGITLDASRVASHELRHPHTRDANSVKQAQKNLPCDRLTRPANLSNERRCWERVRHVLAECQKNQEKLHFDGCYLWNCVVCRRRWEIVM